MLDVIHRGIRARSKFGNRLRRQIGMKDRDTNGNAEWFVGRAGIDAQAPGRSNETDSSFPGNICVGAVHPHGELVATEACNQIAGISRIR